MIPIRQRCLTKTPIRIVASFVLATLTCCGSYFQPHPNHFSTAEVRWNQQTGNFEIALNVWPPDLEKAISRQSGKAIDLDKDEQLDEMIAELVRKNFFIRKTSDLRKNQAKRSTDRGTDASTEDKTPSPSSKQSESEKIPASDSADSPESEPPVADPAITDFPKPESSESSPTASNDLDTPPGSEAEKKTSAANAVDVARSTISSPAGTEKDNEKSAKAAFDEHGFRWVGYEATLKEAWLYFEIKGDTEVTNWQIENRIFFEFNEEQVNQVRLNCGNQPKSYSLKQNDPSYQFATEKKSRLTTSPPPKK